MTIWFPYLKTDWCSVRQPSLQQQSFVISFLNHGRKLIREANVVAHRHGIEKGMSLADARVIIPGIKDIDDEDEMAYKLLERLARYCYRFTPVAAIDLPDSLVLDITGCTHLWGDEKEYFDHVISKIKNLGFHVRATIAGTIGAAWAIAHFDNHTSIVQLGNESAAIAPLHPAALRLEPLVVEKLLKLGLYNIAGFIWLQRSALRRRFGAQILLRIDQALGTEEEIIEPVQQIITYQERLSSLEPIIHFTGIEIALRKLLEILCSKLAKDGKGLRTANFICYKTDHQLTQISIGTNRATHNIEHLFKLFEIKLAGISPEPGIELFVLEARQVEDINVMQHALWNGSIGIDNNEIAELLDRIANKFGDSIIQRFLPDEHYWPERSIKQATSIKEQPAIHWRKDKQRPLRLLQRPALIQVAAPIPDYPPMNFRYNGKLYHVKKADGPERIEHEWWLEHDIYRDYYCVEDELGGRYWIFRAGSYDDALTPAWYIHGFFA